MKVYKVSLTFAENHIDILGQDIRLAFTCPLVLWSNIFSKTTWPIKAKFQVETPWEGEKKVYIYGPGHMTKMAAMPIYGKNLQKSSLEQEIL